ncbi:MAG: SAM-dependent chlorinase/fluorinase [Desulfovibrionales bacterium]|nr:SAM-dependent chlorinase/fluorinase [Desulfovibrionales bacterium]
MSLSFFLLTDFGTSDPYVAQMKGVLQTLAPQHAIYDITHSIAPHNIAQASFYLDGTIDHLPPYAIVVCVVDPGVGTSRDILCMTIGEKTILAPDNGCLSFPAKRYSDASIFRVTQQKLPLECTTHSCTFHGRTTFSPLAADIARYTGQLPSYANYIVPEPFSQNSTSDCQLESPDSSPVAQPSFLAPYMKRNGHARTSSIVTLPETMAAVRGNTIETHVLHIDRFGNVVLALPAKDWNQRIEHCGELTLTTQSTHPLKKISAYQDLHPEQVGIICGSQGYLELACYMCPASEYINVTLGDSIKIYCSVPPEI